MAQKDTNVNKGITKQLVSLLLLCLSVFGIFNRTFAQDSLNNITKFKRSFNKLLTNEVNFKGYSFEGFSVLIKVNGAGDIDTCIISLSALPEFRERLNTIKKHIDYAGLKAEINEKKWKNVNVVLPVMTLFYVHTDTRSFIQLVDYSNERMNKFTSFEVGSYESPITNAIILSPLVLIRSEPIR